MRCLNCKNTVGLFDQICPYCGNKMYDDKPVTGNVQYQKENVKKKRLRDFSDEEILAMGLYPQNESYKRSLISRIVGKR